MKKPSLYLAYSLLLLIATADLVTAQTNVNLKGGLNFSNVIFEDAKGNPQNTQFIPGLQLGLSVDVSIGGEFYIQPGVLYSRKGFKQKDSWYAGSSNNFRVTAAYFQLPVKFLYKPALGNDKLLLGAGPYLGYGTGGKWASDEPVVTGDVIHDDHGDVIFSNDAFNGGGDNSYLYGRAPDYGANFLAGYEFFDNVSAYFNFQLGLANLQPEYSDGTKREGSLKNIGYSVSIGYRL